MKFSIIVPVFNISKYITRCIDSILNQTFQDYEIIIVDDGSTDNSGVICDQIANAHDNIIVIHEENAGLSAARNNGIKKASSEYLLFLDGDDQYCSNKFLSDLSSIKVDSDVLSFHWIEVPAGTNEVCSNNAGEINAKQMTGKEYLDAELSKPEIYTWYIWRYAFKREFWENHDFKFEVGKKYEDVRLTFKIILNAKKIVSTNIIGYGYSINRDNSITQVVRYDNEKDKLMSAVDSITAVQKSDEISAELKAKLCDNFSSLYYSVLIDTSMIKDASEQKAIKKLLVKYKYICTYSIHKKQRIAAKLVKILGVGVTSKILGIRRKIKNG